MLSIICWYSETLTKSGWSSYWNSMCLKYVMLQKYKWLMCLDKFLHQNIYLSIIYISSPSDNIEVFLLKYILVFSFLRIVSLSQWIYIALYIKLRFWRSSCNMRFIFLRVHPITSQQHIVYLKSVSYIYGNKKVSLESIIRSNKEFIGAFSITFSYLMTTEKV